MPKENSIARGVVWLAKKVAVPFNTDTGKPLLAVVILLIELSAIAALLTYLVFDSDFERKEISKKVEQLALESARGLESFNSEAFEQITAKSDTTDTTRIKILFDSIEKPNRRYLLPLLALRQLSPNAFAQLDSSLAAGILTDALKQAVYFNEWGRPDLYWVPERKLERPVDLIIKVGAPVIAGLELLLAEKRDAPMWGSLQGLPPDMEPYQVNDYAIALIHRIRGDRSFEGGKFPGSRKERDDLIDDYLKKYVKADNPELYMLLTSSVSVAQK